MKQKILIRLTMTDDKTRAKAMNIVAQFSGLTSVEIKGDYRNEIEVTGEGVDMITLTRKLRKEVAHAELVSVSKVEPPKKPDDKAEPFCPWPHGYRGLPCYSYPYQLPVGEPVYNHEPPCSIM